MTLKERITEDMKAAMRASDKERLSTIRMVQAAAFEQGGRPDLADKEKAEISLLQVYLPAQLSDAEVDALIREAIAATGASSVKDMGKVMGAVKAKAAGRADMGAVSARIKAALAG